MPTLGTTRPRGLVVASGANALIPRAAADYTIGTSIVVPKGWGERSWWPFRTSAESATRRGEMLGFGDSTLHGAGGLYSLMQRIRDRAVSFGLTDGGKGVFAGSEYEMLYDAPEVNGWSASHDAAGTGTGFTDSTDSYDATGGNFYFDDGSPANANRVLSFRGTCGRLWYSKRAGAGQFRYRIDGGAWTTVDAYMTGEPVSTFEYVSGLTLGNHTCEVENLASTTQDTGVKGAWIAFAGMNTLGFTTQKFAQTGQTFSTFNGTWRYWAALGLTYTSGAKNDPASYAVDTTPVAGGRVKPVLAWIQLGFNDLSADASGAAALAATGVENLAAACETAGIDMVVASGQLPYNANWGTHGMDVYNAMKNTAATVGAVFVDIFTPIGGPAPDFAGVVSNPHLTKAEYVTQADYAWDGFLGAR